jgi:hypothetical protein
VSLQDQANGGPVQPQAQKQQQPLQAWRPGQPVKRTDSIGNEETFVDAES